MGYTTGGIIIRGKGLSTNEECLKRLAFGNTRFLIEQNVADVMSSTFNHVGISGANSWKLIINRDFPYKVSFKKHLSKMDHQLEELSQKYAILVFHMNSFSESYCFSSYSDGKRQSVFCRTADEPDYSNPSELIAEFKAIESGEKFLFSQIDSFIEDSFSNLLYEENLEFEVYKV